MQTINIERLRKLDYRANEAYKNLRTNIQLCGSDVKVIMFTSTTPGEGKSTAPSAARASTPTTWPTTMVSTIV